MAFPSESDLKIGQPRANEHISGDISSVGSERQDERCSNAAQVHYQITTKLTVAILTDVFFLMFLGLIVSAVLLGMGVDSTVFLFSIAGFCTIFGLAAIRMLFKSASTYLADNNVFVPSDFSDFLDPVSAVKKVVGKMLNSLSSKKGREDLKE